jgi:hypothetical protein
MEGDDAGTASDGTQQCRNVREADYRLRALGDGTVINSIEQPDGAIAASNAPNCIDRGVLERSVQVVEALIVGAGQVPVAVIGIFAQYRFVIQSTAELLSAC